MPAFCAHPGCLDRELRALSAAEVALWRRAAGNRGTYRQLVGRLSQRVAMEASTREP